MQTRSRMTAALAIAFLAAATLSSCSDEEAPPAEEESGASAEAEPEDGADDDTEGGDDGAGREDDGNDDGAGGDDSAGSPDAPVAIGEAVEVGNYDVVLEGVTPDAEQIILDENSYNEPAPEGMQFVLFEVEATYAVEGTGWIGSELTFALVDSSGEEFLSRGADADCGVIPQPLINAPELANGESASGNVCLVLPPDVLEDGVLSAWFGLDGQPYYFALDG